MRITWKNTFSPTRRMALEYQEDWYFGSDNACVPGYQEIRLVFGRGGGAGGPVGVGSTDSVVVIVLAEV